MKSIFENQGIFLNDEQIEKLQLFKDLLLEYNGKFNLTSIKEDNEIYIKHFLDSIIGKDYFNLNAKVIEIGSGGGFPSIPLKIVREDLNFTLVESTGKKCNFLEICGKKLGFNNFKVINKRAEDIAKDNNYREKFDHCTARAVARLNTLCEYCLPFVKIGGTFISYKSNDQLELKEGQNAIKILGGKLNESFDYSLQNIMDKRSIYIIKKVSNTPDIYPRGNGKERNKPLL